MSSHDQQTEKVIARGTMNALVIEAIAPILIMLLVGSLTYFLIDVFYQGGFNLRVKYILSLFIMAVVLIARISIDEGRSYASMYAIPLALATWFVTGRFVVFEGPILGSLNFLILPCLLALIWWCADRLTWDCTVVDFSRDVSNQGLLQSVAERMRDVQETGEALVDGRVRDSEQRSDHDEESKEPASSDENSEEPVASANSDDKSAWSHDQSSDHRGTNSVNAATFGLDESGNVVDPSRIDLKQTIHGTTSRQAGAATPWWKTLPIFKRKRNTPGVWVFYFSLAAIPIFGLGQALVPASNVGTRRWLFLYFVIYTMAGLGLLLTTSLLSLQRYLRQRNVEMPNPVAVTWIVAGGIGIVAILSVVWLLPRPAPEYAVLPNPIKIVSRQYLRPNRNGWGNEGTSQQRQDQKTVSKSNGQDGPNTDSRSNSSSQTAKNGTQSGKSGAQQSKSGANSSKSKPITPPEQSSASASNSKQQTDSKQSDTEPSSSGNSSANQTKQGGDRTGQEQQQQDSSSNTKSGSNESNQPQSNRDDQGQNASRTSDQNSDNQDQEGSADSSNNDGQNSSSQSQGQRGDNRTSRDTNSRTNSSNEEERSTGSGSQSQEGRPNERQASSKSSRNNSSEDGTRSQQSRQSRPSNSNPLDSGFAVLKTIANNFKWVVAAIVFAIIIFLGWKYRQQLAESWRDFCLRWKQLLARLFGRRRSRSEAPLEEEATERIVLPQFTAFADPFESGQWQQWSPKQLLAYTFDAFEAWGRDRACPRDVDATPGEYAQQIARHDREVGRAARRLAEIYAEVAYSPSPPSQQSTASVRGFWQVMRQRYQVSQQASSALQSEST